MYCYCYNVLNIYSVPEIHVSFFSLNILFQLGKKHILYKLHKVKGLERKLEAYVILLLAISRCKYNGVVFKLLACEK